MTLVRQWSWEHTGPRFHCWACSFSTGSSRFCWCQIFFAVYSASPVERPRGPGALWARLGSGCRPVRPGDGSARHGPGISDHHGAYRQPGRADSAPAVLPAESCSRAKACCCSPERQLVIFGIALCSIAGSRRTPSEGASAQHVQALSKSAWPSPSSPAYSLACPTWAWHSGET